MDTKKKLHILNKKEEGNVIDWLASVLVMIMMFAMIMTMATFARSVDIRLHVNNVMKKYLYTMEENGFLQTEDKTNLEAELESDPYIEKAQVISDGSDGTNVGKNNQVAYGDKVYLKVKVIIKNPVYEYMHTSSRGGAIWFNTSDGSMEEKMERTFVISGTSKW